MSSPSSRASSSSCSHGASDMAFMHQSLSQERLKAMKEEIEKALSDLPQKNWITMPNNFTIRKVPQMNQAVFLRLHSRLSQAGVVGAFPWAAILQAIMAALQGCMNPPATVDALRGADLDDPNNERWLRYCCRQGLRAEGVIATPRRVKEAMEATRKAKEEATDDELQDVLDSVFDWGV